MKPLARSFAVLSLLSLTGAGLVACGSGAQQASPDCQPEYEFPTISEGELTISTYDGMPYYGTPDGKLEGIDVDFLNQFAEASCLEPIWNVTPSSGVIQSVISGRADIAAGGWYATEERGQTVGQSDPSYVELPTIFSTDGASTVEELQGKNVGTVTGYTWVQELKNYGINVSEYQSSDATLNDLATGRIDYAVLGGIDAPYLLTVNDQYSQLVSKTMEPSEHVQSSSNPSLPNYPHTKSNTELTEALNQDLAKYRSSGALVESLEKYGLDPELANVDR
jgi:polar amino acid transport system substrate-binding protein